MSLPKHYSHLRIARLHKITHKSHKIAKHNHKYCFNSSVRLQRVTEVVFQTLYGARNVGLSVDIT